MAEFELRQVYLSPEYIYLSILSLILLCLCKVYMSQRRYYKILPTMQESLSRYLIRNFSRYAFNKNIFNGYPPRAMLVQYICSIYHLNRNENIVCGWLAYLPFIAVISPDAIKEVLDGTNFNEKAWIYKCIHCFVGTGLLTSHGKKWKSRRKLLTPAFHFDILKEFLPIMNKKSSILVKKWKEESFKEFTDIVPDVTLCTLDVICETTLGIDIKAQENNESEYVQTLERFMQGTVLRLLNILYWYDTLFFLTAGRKLKQDIKWLHEFTMSVIQKRKKEFLLHKKFGDESNSKRKPLMDILLYHHLETGQLTEDDIREEVDTFTAEGHETVSMALIWSLYLVGLNKEVQFKIHEELDEIFGNGIENPITTSDLSHMKYLECVIKESMRLYPPVFLVSRNTGKNMTISGYPIPEGSSLFICSHQLHRNEKFYPNPEIFDPNRFTPENSKDRHPFAYLPFAAGPRNCIGQRFAIMEAKTVLADILRNFTVESLDPRDKLLPSFQITLHPTMPVRIKIRQRKKLNTFK